MSADNDAAKPIMEMTDREKLDAIVVFIRKFEKIAALMSKHPMLAGMMPSIRVGALKK